MEAPIVAFLSRMTGTAVTADQAVALSSAQKAAFISWARREAPGLDSRKINSGRFSVRELVRGEVREDDRALSAAPAHGNHPAAGGAHDGIMIGVDIETVDVLPHASD